MGIGKYEGNAMDKVWSEKNKEIQKLLTKEETFELSDREKEIAYLISEGLNNKQIAGRLYIRRYSQELHIIDL